jgi:hypothetical protein
MAVALSVHALTTVATVRRLLEGKDVVPAAHDDLFRHKINALSAAVEHYCGSRHFERATYTGERYNRVRGQYLLLRQYPIISVASVTMSGVVVTAGTADDQYSIDAAEGRLFRAVGWGAPPDADREDRAIVVTYTAGYILPKDPGPTLPADLEDAVAQLVVIDYQLRDKMGLISQSFEGASETYTHWPAHIRSALDRYRRPRS